MPEAWHYHCETFIIRTTINYDAIARMAIRSSEIKYLHVYL